MVPVLEQWLKEGRGVKQPDLQDSINRLRKSNQHNHALQISEWMSDEMKLDLSPADVFARLDLIQKFVASKKLRSILMASQTN